MTHNANDAATVMPLPHVPLGKGWLGNLRTPVLLGQRPLIGLLMILLGGLVFGVLAISLQTNGPFIRLDVPLADSVHAAALQSSPFLRDAMIFGFYLGEHIIVAIGVLLALYFLYKRFWPELCMVAIAWAGEGAMWLVLSGHFQRARPVFTVPIWHQMTAPSFPSGHSISAVMCFGLLAYLVAPKMPSRFAKTVVIVTAVLIILYVGFSRIFLGDHYLTDVLAGYALGIAWFGLVYTGVELVAKRRRI
jgi:membrane-associated phospholipid phosphatase